MKFPSAQKVRAQVFGPSYCLGYFGDLALQGASDDNTHERCDRRLVSGLSAPAQQRGWAQGYRASVQGGNLRNGGYYVCAH
jgi:hypothetical protein